MALAEFIHLRVHTAYSMSEGAIEIKKLAALCQYSHMPALAITDTRNLFGALEFSDTLAKEGIQPIIGCQVAVRNGPLPKPGTIQRSPEPDTLVLLCQNAMGYANLSRLVSKAFLETDAGETPQISLADIAAHAEGLIALTGGVSGAVGRLLAENRIEPAKAALQQLAEVFPTRLYVELQRHGMAEEERIEAALIDLAYALDLPLVATNDCYFATPDMYEAHDALLCMAEKATLSQAERRRVTPLHYFRSSAEMVEAFADLPEAIANTRVIAERCAVMVEKRDPILPRSTRAEGVSEPDALRQLAHDGLSKRLAKKPPYGDLTADDYRRRLDFELETIIQMGFPGYFLIVADFIQWAKDRDIPVGPGRGSGAGSLVAWALLITDLDPLRFNLLFERFLNPERVSMPDFDIDFCQDRREEVIRYVQEAYGHDRVAQIITFGKLQARAVLRSVGRVMEMPLGYVDRLCKMVPNNPAAPMTLKQAIDSEPQLQAVRDSDPQVAAMLAMGQRLEGLYSHASTHAAGVVIGDRPLHELVPLYRDPGSTMPVTQFNMKWVESAGLVKFDFLGLKTLTVLQMAVRLLARRGVVVVLEDMPLDDSKTYDMLSRGEAAGVFQLESQGMRDVLTRLRPDCLEDIVAIVALYRPGPMDNIPSFIARKQGQEKIDYMHPDLEVMLTETYGIMVYQEQVMQAAQILAGYTLGKADLLRRAMGKKDQAEMDRQQAMFEEGCIAKGMAQARATEFFGIIKKFAGYGFNKSHAAAYGLVAYQTAWFKANHPLEFMAATMTYDMGNTDKLAFFKGEMGRLGLPLLPPDVNRSEVTFCVEDGAVRYALAAVKGVGAAAMDSLVAERRAGGRFTSLSDLAHRLDSRSINKRIMESLVRAGALDSLESDRARLFQGIESVLRFAQEATDERASGQNSLFGGTSQSVTAVRLPVATLPWSRTDMLNQEKAAIGFFLSAHPLDDFKTTLERLDVVPSNTLVSHIRNGGVNPVPMAAIVAGRKEKTSKSGNRFAFVNFSDAGGAFEAVMFSETLIASRALLDSGVPVLVTVDAKLDGEQLRLTVQHVASLDSQVSRVTGKLTVVVDQDVAIPRIAEIVAKERSGRGRIVLVARTAAQEVHVSLKGGFALGTGIVAALNGVPGVAEVKVV